MPVPAAQQWRSHAQTLAPLVGEKWRWLRVRGLDPGWEESALVSLVPEVLVQVGIRDLLQGLHVVHGDQVTVQVHELNTHLWEGREAAVVRH